MTNFLNNFDENDFAYLNGEILSIKNAWISPLDRGFNFADGVYEVIPVYNRRPFYFDEHISRLFNSLSLLEINFELSKGNILSIVNDLIKRNKKHNQIVYIQITRGVAKRFHHFPKNPVKPTVFIMSSELIRPSKNERDNGICAITYPDLRWAKCNIKSISLLPNVLARQEAKNHSASEAIMFKDGFLTEGAASTIWLVLNKCITVPSKAFSILEGIRISIIEKICKETGHNFTRRNIAYEEFLSSDEIFLSSATKEILPVTSIKNTLSDGKIFRKQVGPIFKNLQSEYDKLISDN